MTGDFFLTNWFLEAMRWIYSLTCAISESGFGNVFLTILISTILLRALTIFSDIKTRKSSAKMAEVQPEIQRLQKKYANDPRRFQAEQTKLMKEKGVSMWGSCLPMLITMPLFFCFIAAFRYWGYEMNLRLLVDENAMELFKSFKFLWINNIWQPDNGLTPVLANGASFLATPQLSNLLYLQEPGVGEKLVEMGLAVTKVYQGGVSYQLLSNDAAIAIYDAAIQPNGYNDYLVTFDDALYRETENDEYQKDAVWTGSDGTLHYARHALLRVHNRLKQVPDEEKIDINGVKRWVGDDKAQRPESITVFLCEEGKEGFIASTVVKPNDEGLWLYSFNDLPEMRDGQKIQYVIREAPVEKYETKVEGYHLVNQYITPSPSPSTTPSPTPEPSVTPSPTPEPSVTPSPTPTATQSPTPSPTPTAPYTPPKTGDESPMALWLAMLAASAALLGWSLRRRKHG